jgi:hypothetical protein
MSSPVVNSRKRESREVRAKQRYFLHLVDVVEVWWGISGKASFRL